MLSLRGARSATKQSLPHRRRDCFASLAMTPFELEWMGLAGGSVAAAQKIRCRRRSPHVGDLLGVPDLGPLRTIAMPWPRLEVAELLVLHLVELGVELDHPVVV